MSPRRAVEAAVAIVVATAGVLLVVAVLAALVLAPMLLVEPAQSGDGCVPWRCGP